MTGSAALAGDVGFSPEDGMWCPPGGVASSVGISSGEAGPSKVVLLKSGSVRFGADFPKPRTRCWVQFRGFCEPQT
jgi:hypothetical protein